ncbi:histidinol-phosphatase HisJ family protein [candidate division KSB1 bacterium]|nr:histidinol-phosphatase HisJ family protein [candidate division KSB1 bacterium]RQW10460.1 MAG: histidinol-phosphatase HisJ family protein [candidate division KSB1 bacterium]
MVDYHVHSYLCRHGEGEIEQYIESAIARGLTEIGFAEHIPIPDLDDPTGRMPIESWDIYVRDVLDAQRRYRDITVRFGIEADYLPAHMAWIAEFLAAYPFDYVIGSVHFVNDWDFSNPAFRHRLDEAGVDALYIAYYRLIAEAAATGLYDIIGHLDLPKKLCVQPTIDLSDPIGHALEAIRQHDLALDVNTSGLRKEAGEIYPNGGILRRAFLSGIPIALGSDAHKPAEVAARFAEAITLVKTIGYAQCCVYDDRRRSLIEL